MRMGGWTRLYIVVFAVLTIGTLAYGYSLRPDKERSFNNAIHACKTDRAAEKRSLREKGIRDYLAGFDRPCEQTVTAKVLTARHAADIRKWKEDMRRISGILVLALVGIYILGWIGKWVWRGFSPPQRA
jgi:hypothetical protein